MQARPMDLPINGFITTDNDNGNGKRVHMFVHRDMPTLRDDVNYYEEGQWRKKQSRIVRWVNVTRNSVVCRVS
jgi:hypothetical protein